MIDQLINKIIELQNPTCVGLDTDFSYIPELLREDISTPEGAAEAIIEFNMNIIDKISDIVPAVKVQVAYYEMFGVPGMRAFDYTINYARGRGLFVIADCKRNDIGSTAACYSRAYLGETQITKEVKINPFCADMVTINGYFGTDGIAPFIDDMKKFDKGGFVLVKTSNPSAGELQNLKLEGGEYVYEHMGRLVEDWGKDLVGYYGYSDLGAVVGATHPEEAGRLREILKNTFFLIPGYGAQGADAGMIKCCFDEKGLGGIVNSSRGIICAYQKEEYAGMSYSDAARAACLDMQQDIVGVLGKIG